jgi:non-ribosomal peptide synthetase component F
MNRNSIEMIQGRCCKKTVVDLFEECCLQFPENIAVTLQNGDNLKYSELDVLASSIQELISQKVFSNESPLQPSQDTPLVAVMMDRNFSFIIAMLGVLKAGCAYVPIDPSFPPDRQIHIFTHSKCEFLVVDELSCASAQLLGVELPSLIVLNSKGNILNDVNVSNMFSFQNLTQDNVIRSNKRQNDESRLAYILYTSGSTGKPKGVMVKHVGVANTINWFADELKVTTESRVLGLTTFCFDISVLEIFIPLTRGAVLVLASTALQKDPFALIELIEKTSVTLFQATPTTYEMMLASGWAGSPTIDFLVIILYLFCSVCCFIFHEYFSGWWRSFQACTSSISI